MPTLRTVRLLRCMAMTGLLLGDAARAQDGSIGASDQTTRGGSLTPMGGPLQAPPLRVLQPPVVPPPGPLKPAPATPPTTAAGQTTPASDASGSDSAVPAPASTQPAEIPALPPPPQLSITDENGLPKPKLVHRRSLNLIFLGIGLTVATWSADRLLGRDLSDSAVSWVPVVGPWYLLQQQNHLAAPSQSIQALLVVDGVLQLSGLTMAILGTVLTTPRYVVTVKPSPTSNLNQLQ